MSVSYRGFRRWYKLLLPVQKCTRISYCPCDVVEVVVSAAALVVAAQLELLVLSVLGLFCTSKRSIARRAREPRVLRWQ